MHDGALKQPLITRPAAESAGQGAIAQSELPGGGPSDKGLPLDSGLPGSSTHSKDVNDVREFDQAHDKSIHRVDNADGLLSEPDRIDVREDNAGNHDGVRPWDSAGNGDEDATAKTRYPYRDGIPNTKNASAQYVLSAWESEQAPVRRVFGDRRMKVAVKLSGILEGLNPKVVQRGTRCTARLKRADVKNLRWILAVDCHKGGGPRVVKVKAVRDKGTAKLAKMDLDLSCSCPAWRWQGAEHHSQREEYLDGTPRGTASVPVIRDPDGINRVCKHVYAAVQLVRKWGIGKRPSKKKEKNDAGL